MENPLYSRFFNFNNQHQDENKDSKKRTAKQKNEHYLYLIQYIIETNTGFKIESLKQQFDNGAILITALQHVTTTKKALAKALDIEVESLCAPKRTAEKMGLLVQSRVKVVCPYTGYKAHLLTTNPNEFWRMRNMVNPQKR